MPNKGLIIGIALIISGFSQGINNRFQMVSDEEYDLLKRVCMSECGGEYGEPLEGKVAVVRTIFNRCRIYKKSIAEIVYEPNQYSTANNGTPDDSVALAVELAIIHDCYPKNMIYFNAGGYADYYEPYTQIGAHYFGLTN